VFPELPDDIGVTDPGLILSTVPELAVEAARAPVDPGLAPADAPEVAVAEAPELADEPAAVAELGLAPADAPEVADDDPADPIAEGLNADDAPVFTPKPAVLKLKPIWFR